MAIAEYKDSMSLGGTTTPPNVGCLAMTNRLFGCSFGDEEDGEKMSRSFPVEISYSVFFLKHRAVESFCRPLCLRMSGTHRSLVVAADDALIALQSPSSAMLLPPGDDISYGSLHPAGEGEGKLCSISTGCRSGQTGHMPRVPHQMELR